MSPLVPADWEGIEAPMIRVEPPGPRSREILERIGRSAYPGLATGLTPLALASKRAWTVTDADDNVYLDLASASASVPLGAGREEILEPAIEAELVALREACFRTEDFYEGVRAFAEKRPPQWQGR